MVLRSRPFTNSNGVGYTRLNTTYRLYIRYVNLKLYRYLKAISNSISEIEEFQISVLTAADTFKTNQKGHQLIT